MPELTLENPATGETYTFAERASRTSSEYLRLRWSARPGAAVAEHVHPVQDETFMVTEGALTLWIDGRERTCRAGQRASVPAGSHHAFANREASPVSALLELRPALRMQAVFEALAGFGREGVARPGGLPRNPLLLAVFAHEFRAEIRGTRPPPAVQRVALPLLAAIGRRLGHAAHRPEYTVEIAGRRA